MNDNVPLEDHLIALERERCRCLAEQDFRGLSAILSPQLSHVHTRGNVDGLTGYLHFVQEVVQVQALTRGPLTVHRVGDGAALMLGRQSNRSRSRTTGDEAVTDSQVMQVWAREGDGAWRLAAFQGTAVPGAR